MSGGVGSGWKREMSIGGFEALKNLIGRELMRLDWEIHGGSLTLDICFLASKHGWSLSPVFGFSASKHGWSLSPVFGFLARRRGRWGVAWGVDMGWGRDSAVCSRRLVRCLSIFFFVDAWIFFKFGLSNILGILIFSREMADGGKTMVVKLLEGVRTVDDFERMREDLKATNVQLVQSYLAQKINDGSSGKHYQNIRTKTYNDGSFYEGEFSRDLRDGCGYYQYEGGDKYLGNWKNDKFNGQGTYIYSNGERFDGNYLEGLREGHGKFFAFNGGIYDGNFVRDKRNGHGTYTYFGTAESYEGYWQDNYKHGKGTFYYAYGDVYEGEFENNDRSGHGKLHYNDGGSYDGEWKKDLANGFGTLKTVDGKTYKGDFQRGRKHGKGEMTSQPEGFNLAGYSQYSQPSHPSTSPHTQELYNGDWRNNEKVGYGVHEYANGDSYEGEWKDGARNGRGTYNFKNGDTYNGSWEND